MRGTTAAHSLTFPPTQPTLALEAVTLVRRQHAVVSNVSRQVPFGAHVAWVGPNCWVGTTCNAWPRSIGHTRWRWCIRTSMSMPNFACATMSRWVARHIWAAQPEAG